MRIHSYVVWVHGSWNSLISIWCNSASSSGNDNQHVSPAPFLHVNFLCQHDRHGNTLPDSKHATSQSAADLLLRHILAVTFATSRADGQTDPELLPIFFFFFFCAGDSLLDRNIWCDKQVWEVEVLLVAAAKMHSSIHKQAHESSRGN